jgi:hypothetical protein
VLITGLEKEKNAREIIPENCKMQLIWKCRLEATE